MKRALLITLASLASIISLAQGPTETDAIRALIGEVGNQSPRTYLLVASAIRNRDTLQGVYGLHNPCVNTAPPELWARARAAWSQSQTNRLTCAKYFGCPGDANYFLNTLHYHPVAHSGTITFYQP